MENQVESGAVIESAMRFRKNLVPLPVGKHQQLIEVTRFGVFH